MDMVSPARQELDDRTALSPFLPRQTAGRPPLVAGSGSTIGGGKSGLHGNTVPVNGRRGRPQGKCHRNHTARASVARQPAGKGETGRQERTAPLVTEAAG